MTFYLDASFVVTAITDEQHTLMAINWIAARSESLAVSSWTLTEVASALSIKVRTGQIKPEDKIASSRQFERMQNTFLLKAPINEVHFFAARRFADDHMSGLRGGDALHTAIAADYDLSLVTFDRTLATGARMMGLGVVLFPDDTSQ